MALASRHIALTLLFSACVAPQSQLDGISPEEVKAEQLRQQQLVLKGELRDQQRLENVAHGLLRHSVDVCGPGHKATRSGFRVANVHTFSKQYQAAARGLGFSDTLTVVGVTSGSAAERSGLQVGDRLTSIGPGSAPAGRTAVNDFAVAMRRQANADAGMSMVVRRAPLDLSLAPVAQAGASVGVTDLQGEVKTIALAVDTLCAFNLSVIKDSDLNAFADGENIYITSGMMRFAQSDDELAVVVAHEAAHNAMDHIKAKKKNAAWGAVLGAVLDVAAASQGVNTQGQFSNDMAAIGAQVFSQDFEREADYVGMYILARSGRPYATAANFWRRMAEESPGSIKFASSHPTTAERFVRLERAAAEIEEKRQASKPLLPELKKK